MLVNVQYDPVGLYNQVIVATTLLSNILNDTNLDQIYAPDGFAIEDDYFIGSQLDMPFNTAATYCHTDRMDLFATTPNMKLLELLDTFGAKKIWTQYSESKVSKTIVDLDQYPPHRILADTVVSTSLLGVPELHAVILEKVENGESIRTELHTQAKDQMARVICKGKIPFPKAEKDRARLSKILDNVKNELNATQEFLFQQKSEAKNEWHTLFEIQNYTEFKAVSNKTQIVEIDFDQSVKKWLLQLNTTFINETLYDIKTDSDVTLLVELFGQFFRTIGILTDLIQSPLENPLSLLPESVHREFSEKYKENQSPLRATTESDGKRLLVEFLSNKDVKILSKVFPRFGNFSYFNVQEDEFYEITIWDLVLAILYCVQYIAFAIPAIWSMYSDRKFHKKILKSRKNVSIKQLTLPVKKKKYSLPRQGLDSSRRTRFRDVEVEEFSNRGKTSERIPTSKGSYTVYIVHNDDTPLYLL